MNLHFLETNEEENKEAKSIKLKMTNKGTFGRLYDTSIFFFFRRNNKIKKKWKKKVKVKWIFIKLN